jgi:hypothetical protein
VRRHYKLVLADRRAEFLPERWAEVERLAADVEAFNRAVILVPEQLEVYVNELDALAPPLLWWSSVAHPSLSHLWKQ